jgi:hypothetical protein
VLVARIELTRGIASRSGFRIEGEIVGIDQRRSRAPARVAIASSGATPASSA